MSRGLLEGARLNEPRALPTALIIGPMKAGTTWVHEYLGFREDVCLPADTKEVFFFDRYFHRGVGWYSRHFSHFNSDAHLSVLEVAPSLFHSDAAPGRVCAALGDIPLVVTTRDPVQRSWSHYLHLRRYGYTNKALKEAVQEFPEIISASCYHEGIVRWKRSLPRSQVFLLDMEQLRDSPEAYVKSLCTMLGLPFLPPPAHLLKPENQGADPPSFVVARLSRLLSRLLRWAGLYGLLQRARDLGIRDLVFGRPGSSAGVRILSSEDASWLAEMIDARERAAKEA